MISALELALVLAVGAARPVIASRVPRTKTGDDPGAGSRDSAASVPPHAPPPPLLPRCESKACPDDFNNSGIIGRFPNRAQACAATTTCVHDVFPGCTEYRGDSDADWGGDTGWCGSTIAHFDDNRTMPQNIADENHPIYYFKPKDTTKRPAYVLYLPPNGALPIDKDQGRYEYFLFQWFKSQNIAVFMVQVPDPDTDLWDHVPVHTNHAPYSYNCSKIKAAYTGMCLPTCDMCVKNRSTDLIEAAIDKAAGLGYTKNLLLMGWSSGGAMASAFLDYAHKANFITPKNTRYTIRGLVMLSSGGQYCYAYDKVADLVGSSYWNTCSAAKQYGCCPKNLTEEHYWRNPLEYTRHPPTLLVQSVLDNDADWDAARYYHEAMVANGAISTHFAVGGANHNTNPAIFGVVASWVLNVMASLAPDGGVALQHN